jgi:hypothetical protein
MVSKCANPLCNKEFQELSKGWLFLLPPKQPVARLIDHCYWLCSDCASLLTVELEGAGPIVRKRQPRIQRTLGSAASGR